MTDDMHKCSSPLLAKFRIYWDGFAVALLVAATATFLSEHYGAPTMLFALLIGISLHFLSDVERCRPGIELSAGTILRLGVGLTGIQLSLQNLQSIGTSSVTAILVMLVCTILCGALLSFAIGRRLAFGLLSGGAVAICGASAALALSAVLPKHDSREKDTAFVVIVVTVLSTAAMVAYPILFKSLGMSDLQTGFLLGATIHDIAQVVGAGYSVSDEAGLTATLVKMIRVSALPLVVLLALLCFRNSQTGPVGIPWFLVLFIALAALRSFIDIPEGIIDTFSQISRWMLVIAIAAIGLRTDLAGIVNVHASYSVILVIETVFLLVIAVAYTAKYIS